MPDLPADYEFTTWEASGRRLRIQYPPAVMEEIRRVVVEGFYALPRGGVEVGGVLFGAWDEGLVRIAAFRPLVCEYARGPAYLLSGNDEIALRDLLRKAVADPSFEGLAPVGWFHSHTRSEVFLSEEDLGLYNHYFPEPWQIALVLRPSPSGHARAGFFFREPDGSVHREASYREFTLTPWSPARPQEGAALTPPEQPAPPAPAEPEPPAVPNPPRHTSRFRWAWPALAAVVIMAGLAWKTYSREPAAAIHLRAIDANGQLVISWDRGSRTVLEATGGSLDIADGARLVHFKLDPDRLRHGGFTYVPRSERVELRMRLERKRAAQEEVLTFLGPPPATDQPPPAQTQAERERDELAREAVKLRAAVRAQRARAVRAEQMVRLLRERLEVEAAPEPE